MEQIKSAAAATIAMVRRLFHVLHALFGAVRRHVPVWVGAVLTVCLFIPGPLDELLLLTVIAVFAAFKPAMRTDIRKSVGTAWNN